MPSTSNWDIPQTTKMNASGLIFHSIPMKKNTDSAGEVKGKKEKKPKKHCEASGGDSRGVKRLRGKARAPFCGTRGKVTVSRRWHRPQPGATKEGWPRTLALSAAASPASGAGLRLPLLPPRSPRSHFAASPPQQCPSRLDYAICVAPPQGTGVVRSLRGAAARGRRATVFARGAERKRLS